MISVGEVRTSIDEGTLGMLDEIESCCQQQWQAQQQHMAYRYGVQYICRYMSFR